MIACHECDLLQKPVAIPPGRSMQCARCGACLRRHRPDGLRRTLACLVGAALLFVVSASFPIVAMEIQGQRTVATLFGAARALEQQGMLGVGVLVFVTTVASPILQIGSMLYMLIPLHQGVVPPRIDVAFRLVHTMKQWGMVEVFILGVLVSLVKLAGIAKVVPGIALWAFAALIVLLAAAAANFEADDLWERVSELRRRARTRRATSGATA